MGIPFDLEYLVLQSNCCAGEVIVYPKKLKLRVTIDNGHPRVFCNTCGEEFIRASEDTSE